MFFSQHTFIGNSIATIKFVRLLKAKITPSILDYEPELKSDGKQ